MIQDFDDGSQNIDRLKAIIDLGFESAAKGLSDMIRANLSFSTPQIRSINIKEMPSILGGPENDAVGIYLQMEGDLHGQIIFVFPFLKALEIIDLIMEEEFGTTKKITSIERSALAEVGNLTGTFFMNSVANLTGMKCIPTPPVVIVDMVGAILDIIVATIGKEQQDVLMFATSFNVGERQTPASFWVIPDASTLQRITG
jgi:chemotaxis protein CheC